MIKISPSVLASDFSRLGEEVAAMVDAGADMIHLDVMDGHFVPNISFGPPIIARLRPTTNAFFDTHLMISDPLAYIDSFAAAGADRITFHLESDSDPKATIDAIRAAGKEPGISLKPATPVSALAPYLDTLSMVLIMTVEPGFGGQSFQPAMLDKLRELAAEREKRGLSFDIQVDGGIDNTTAPLAYAAGANVFVAGTALFGQPNYTAAVNALRQAIQTAR